ncbi:unnamed protein product [Nesidiocoris tenuis]|uniref:Uncharacterized protein n=1 Tax=Nesidiocoris tenuis TaxID=355587 RepID=A0A6H5GZ60_9HEMI|nr:unnamed protein product [Nesidiocoris tenuis]
MDNLSPGSEKPLSDMSPDSGINELAGLTPEEQEKQKQEWASELAQVEEEINTLKLVLSSKVRQAQELKRKLGFSVWRDFQDDMQQGIKNVKESNIFYIISIPPATRVSKRRLDKLVKLSLTHPYGGIRLI